MNVSRIVLVGAVAALCSVGGYVATGNAEVSKGVPADRALTGLPLAMTPDQLPIQFRTQLRGDVKNSQGTAVLKRKGNDVEYTFKWQEMTSSVITGTFRIAPQGQVGGGRYG